MSIVTFAFNRGCLRSDNKRDAGLTVPEGVEYIYDIPYGPDKKWHTLDVCHPKDRPSKATIINVHGGGYVYGSTQTYKFYCCHLASQGYTVVSFNYRLAPKHIFPAPLEDLNLVMEWLCAHHSEYHADPGNVFMVGDSAGAQLASQYAAIYSSREYADIMGIHPPEFRLAALGLNCGMYDISSYSSTPPGLRSVLRAYFTADPGQFGDKLRVLDFINSDFPPAFLLSSKGDFLLDHCAPMAELLGSRGVECEYKIYGDRTTGHVFHVNMRSDLALQANADQLAFFERFIAKEEA